MKQKTTTIIVHPGRAHRDDLVACALILASVDPKGGKVLRRGPSEEELNDPSVWCVDVGLRHEPERLNFDHHQFPRDSAPSCAMTLVMDYLGLLDSARRYGWVASSEVLDSKGPFVFAENLGEEALSRLQDEGWTIPGDDLQEVEHNYGVFSETLKQWLADRFTNNLNPIEKFVLDEFSRRTALNPGSVAYSMLRMLGTNIIEGIEEGAKRLKLIEKHSVYHVLEHFDVLFMTAPEFEGQNMWEAVGIMRKESLKDFGVSVSDDLRGKGWQLCRHDDNPNVDFSRIKDDPDILFVPAGGFLAKTHEKLGDGRVKELIRKASNP